MAIGEWDQRQLCPDGACIGVIGPEGTCKVCGRAAPNWGDERKRGLLETDEDEDEDDDEDDDEDLAGDEEDEDDERDDDDDDGEDDEGEEDDEEGDDEEGDEGDDGLAAASEPLATTSRERWTARQLCPDGACIGVIGPDGRCKVCGRPAVKAPEDADAAPAEAATPETPETREDVSSAAAPDGAPVTNPREPCADTSCSGHIGADGRCEICGKGAS